jgi:hypothetical protein
MSTLKERANEIESGESLFSHALYTCVHCQYTNIRTTHAQNIDANTSTAHHTERRETAEEARGEMAAFKARAEAIAG